MLKQLVLRQKIKAANASLDALRAKDQELETRAAAMKTREAELEAAVNEITVDTPAEDKAIVDAQVEAYEADNATLVSETEAQEAAKKTLTDEIEKLQAELDEIESRTSTPPAAKPEAKDERKDNHMKTTRTRFFDGVPVENRSEMIAREDVKAFATRVRALKGAKRDVTGAELEIPEILLEVLRDNLHRYSKLASKVFVKRVNGKARQTIAGAVPEGIWTEATGALNNLSISFSQIEVDGYKVGGFVAIANSTLEDSDLNLVNEIMDSIGQAIGLGVDKSILFGTGTKMPLGVATRLAQTSAPADWDANGPAWTDLHSLNVLKFDPTSMTPETFFANLLAALGVAKSNYSDGGKVWCMNSKTYTHLMTKMIAFNSAGALVSAAGGTMPIVGGDIVIFEFIADYDIIGGYASLYLLAERAGAQLASSDQVRFLEDQTVFKGTARYDGQPVFGEGFVIVNVNNVNPTTSVSFGTDLANTVATPYSVPVAGSYAGAISVGLYCTTPNTEIYYTVDGSTPDKTKTKLTAAIAIASTKTVKAIAYDLNGNASAVYTAVFTIT